MTEALPFELKLVVSRRFPPGTAAIEAGPYKFTPIPTASADGETVLSLLDSYRHPPIGGSRPEEEELRAIRSDILARHVGQRANWRPCELRLPNGRSTV